MDIRNIRPTRLAWVMPAAVAIGSLIGVTAAPAHASVYTNSHASYSFRSDHNSAYWFQGVRSDAGDGYYGNGKFTGETQVMVDGNPAYTSAGPLTRCTVQLNRIIGRRVYPIPGANRTGVTYDNGLSCDVWDDWRVPPGRYNITVSYEADGRWYTTVQGPAVNYPGR